MTWVANLRDRISSSTEKRRKSRQVDDTLALPKSSTTSRNTSDKLAPSPPPPPPLINPLYLTSTPTPSYPTSASPPSAVQKPPLYQIPSEIITATEKGMISASLCATTPSSSSTASSQKHDYEARDVAADTGEERPLPVLTRAEEACGGEGRKSSWEKEGGRCVMFKGVDV